MPDNLDVDEAEYDAENADEEDPFSPDNIGVVNFITAARTYDVLVAILGELNPDKAKSLLEVHLNGGLMGPIPKFAGNFITSELNAQDNV